MFETIKILQMISYLLSINNKRMNVLKLMKELYLIDRASIAERDTSISGDTYFSLPHGPVLSCTLNLLDDLKLSKEEKGQNPLKPFLSAEEAKYYYDVILTQEPEYDYLSEKDKEYIVQISERFKNYTPYAIEQYTHKNLPEWTDPQGSHSKIRYYDIAKALGKSDEEIMEAKQEYEQLINFKQLIGNAS
jgi:hypothetical protein